MAKKVYLQYGCMNSSKTASLIMTHFNYREQGQNPMILKPSIDNREGSEPLVKCRAGLSASATIFSQTDNLFFLAARLAGAKDTDFNRYPFYPGDRELGLDQFGKSQVVLQVHHVTRRDFDDQDLFTLAIHLGDKTIVSKK